MLAPSANPRLKKINKRCNLPYSLMWTECDAILIRLYGKLHLLLIKNHNSSMFFKILKSKTDVVSSLWVEEKNP